MERRRWSGYLCAMDSANALAGRLAMRSRLFSLSCEPGFDVRFSHLATIDHAPSDVFAKSNLVGCGHIGALESRVCHLQAEEFHIAAVCVVDILVIGDAVTDVEIARQVSGDNTLAILGCQGDVLSLGLRFW